MFLKIFAIFFSVIIGLHAEDAPVHMGETHVQRIQADLLALQKFVYKRFGGGQDYHESGLTPPSQNEAYEATQALEAGMRDLTQKIETLEKRINDMSSLAGQVDTLRNQIESAQKKPHIDRLKSASDIEFLHFLNTDMHLIPDAEKEDILKLFLERFPNHPDKAVYLKQLIYRLYKDKQFKDTARYAGQFYKQNPNALETPAVLLLLALSLYELNKLKDACLTLDKIETINAEKITADLKHRLNNARTKCGCTPPESNANSPTEKIS